MKSWNMIYTQDANSQLMETIIFTLDHSMTAMTMIVIITTIVAIKAMKNDYFTRSEPNMNPIENFWIITPILLLYFIVFPSLHSLYNFDDSLISNNNMVIKVTGHQWYWDYEHTIIDKSYDSYMIPNSENVESPARLLLTDNHLTLPSATEILFAVTSEDVIHSWTMPSAGVKMDAMPGRMNQIYTSINRSGLYTGQCSELCGAGHSFMPITVSSVPPKEFINQILNDQSL